MVGETIMYIMKPSYGCKSGKPKIVSKCNKICKLWIYTPIIHPVKKLTHMNALLQSHKNSYWFDLDHREFQF